MANTAWMFALGIVGATTLAAAPAIAQTAIHVQISPQGRYPGPHGPGAQYPGPHYPSSQYPSPNYPRSQFPSAQYPGPHFQGAPRHAAPPPYYRADDSRARWAYQDGRRPRDLDRDGIPDRYDRDLDNDGVRNSRDRDVDGDGVPNWHDRRPYNPYRY